MEHYKFFSGYGYDAYELVAFDKALQDAQIGDYNIVKVSSILPPYCIETQTIGLEKGSVLYAAYASITIAPGENASTAVALAKPRDVALNGVIFECSLKNSGQDIEKIVKRMCESAMESRKRSVENIESLHLSISNQTNMFCSLITGIALW